MFKTIVTQTSRVSNRSLFCGCLSSSTQPKVNLANLNSWGMWWNCWFYQKGTSSNLPDDCRFRPVWSRTSKLEIDFLSRGEGIAATCLYVFCVAIHVCNVCTCPSSIHHTILCLFVDVIWVIGFRLFHSPQLSRCEERYCAQIRSCDCPTRS